MSTYVKSCRGLDHALYLAKTGLVETRQAYCYLVQSRVLSYTNVNSKDLKMQSNKRGDVYLSSLLCTVLISSEVMSSSSQTDAKMRLWLAML